MIGLKELTFDNETIKCLQYKTLRYIKANPCVHLNWICNKIYTLLFISFLQQAFTFNEFYDLIGLEGNMMLWLVMQRKINNKLNKNYKIVEK
jgi:hypothetical protein